MDRTAFTDRGGSLLAKLGKAATAAVILDGADLAAVAIAEIAAGLRLRHYRFDKYKSKKKDDDKDEPTTLTVTLYVNDAPAADAAIARRMPIVDGALLARDLINEPPNVLGPVEFADEVQKLTAFGIEVDILLPEDMQKLGMNSLLCVAWGSRRPARLAVMQWKGGNPGDAPLAFVGKGVTFDTGGLDIKPSAGMLLMKKDMGGAANVLGLAHAIMDARLKVRLRVLIPIVENSISATAFRPGDILPSRSGMTVEIGNTDAEGRLILGDALTLADEESPQLILDMATLTGAARTALGPDLPPLYSTDDGLARELMAAGLSSDDPLWQMPLWAPYDQMLSSKIADVNHVSAGAFAGSITAALFLKRFVRNARAWVHLDIFAWAPEARPGRPQGGTDQGIHAAYGVLKQRYS